MTKPRRLKWIPIAAAAVLIGVALSAWLGPQVQAEIDSGSDIAATSKAAAEVAAPDSPQSVGASMVAAGASVALDPTDVSGSTVATDDCYQAGKTQTLCFTVYNGSTDGEWLSDVRLTFPTLDGNWQVTCRPAFQDGTDSIGYTVNFSCTIPTANEVVYTDGDSDGFGEISSGSSWGTCVDLLIPSAYTGDRFVQWGLVGDGGMSSPPHDTTGALKVEQCTPLMLRPGVMAVEGCNGTPQMLEFRLDNYAAGNADVDLTYLAPGADFVGPQSFQIGQGETITFVTQFEPHLCLRPGEQINASLTVASVGGPHFDTAIITQTITENGGWRRRDDSPVPAMDNAVVWANHADGGLWSVGGYGSKGAAQRYDPASGAWLTYTNPLTPVIEYPMDGCYGLNDGGDEIVVLFPDTIVTGTLQIFNITHRTWYTEPVPVPGYPPEGRWGQDIVSMLQHTGENACYLSGGSTREGGGRTQDLWRYEPGTNSASYVGAFPAAVWFGFHASWYVPWVGDEGALCVGGGVDHNHQINNSTQCYDLKDGVFNAENADLGTLPERWWGMADGWQIEDGQYQIWIANGVAQDGTLLPASAYFREGMVNFEYGPEIPHGMYRLEGDAWEDQFYTLNGSRGGFWYSEYSLHLGACPVCFQVFLPEVLRLQ